jgi:hypothetical protein
VPAADTPLLQHNQRAQLGEIHPSQQLTCLAAALQVTEVLLGVYSSLGSSQQRLTFFTLLAREFGVQGGQRAAYLSGLVLCYMGKWYHIG